MIKGYMTKYALSAGISEVTVRRGAMGSDYCYTTGEYPAQLKEGRDFSISRKDAVEAAKKMALKKVASLKKSMAKMEKLAKTPKWVKA